MKRDIVGEFRAEYWAIGKKQKGEILNNLEFTTKMPRKSLIRCLNRPRKKEKELRQRGQPVPRGRPRKYSAETEAALAFVWETYNFPCAERLHEELTEAVRVFKRDRMWHYSDSATESLLNMSLGSLKLRTVAMAGKHGLMRGIATTKPSGIRQAIPVFEGDWSRQGLGHGQIDTVVHSGPKLMGSMVYTVNFVDAATYWQEPIAQLNKGEKATLASMKLLQKQLPFKLRGLHPDTGSEFVNWLAKDWCDRQGIELTRSQPSRKNDNCFIEQRNNVVVRNYLGYERFDCQEAVKIMNELYEVLRLYLNFFQSTYKLIDKVSYESLGQHRKGYKRLYDQPATPYRRLSNLTNGANGIGSAGNVNVISEDKIKELAALYETLNPKVLRDRILALTTKLRKVQKELGYHF